jgi:hypothetical protein
MRYTTFLRGLGLAAVFAASGCKSLDITNPNDPDGDRALSDPASLESFVGGSVQGWFNTYEGLTAGGPLVTQAQTYSASWNNFNMNFYSGIDGAYTAGANRNTRPWQNDPSAAGRTSIEWYWEGYYRSLGLANQVLRAIRVNGKSINGPSDTKRAETVAELMRGAALSGIAMNYDKGYALNEESDLAALTYVDRKAVRDSALAAFDRAIALAGANSFTTPSGWANGPTYTNTQIAKIANTMAAYLIANWPRDAAEAATADWARVATYAGAGMSSGGRFDYVFEGDGDTWYPEFLAWFNAMDTGRLSTRVAALLDPATQTHPYPSGGNPQPNSPDKRLGDGSFGNASMVGGFGNVPKTANAGTDFAWSSQEIFNVSRGMYHQSNIAHIRYDLTGTQSPSGAYAGRGPAVVFSAAQNDLLLAESLLRRNTNLAQAATLINNTRVTRGGLSAAAAGDGQAALLTKWQYEMEIEVLGLGPASYYHRRRAVNGLLPGTPREMPVPAKELGVFGQPLYTFGGTGLANSPTPP